MKKFAFLLVLVSLTALGSDIQRPPTIGAPVAGSTAANLLYVGTGGVLQQDSALSSVSLFASATPAEKITFSKDGTFSTVSSSIFTANTTGGNFGWTTSFRNLGSNGLRLLSTDTMGFQSDTTFGSIDTNFSRSAAGLIEINNGTPGQYRDLKLRDLSVIDAAAVVTPGTPFVTMTNTHGTSDDEFGLKFAHQGFAAATGEIASHLNPGGGSSKLLFYVGGTEYIDLDGAGNVVVGGPTAPFVIDNMGNLAKIRTVPYTWPGSQGGASTFLQNDGAGALSWASVPSPSLQTAFDGGRTIDVGSTSGIQMSTTGAPSEFLKIDDGTNTTDFHSSTANISAVRGTADPAYFAENDATNGVGYYSDVEGTGGVALELSPGTSGTYWMVLDGYNSGKLRFTARGTIIDYDLTWPAVQGTAGSSLDNNGSGILSWVEHGAIEASGSLVKSSANALADSVTENIFGGISLSAGSYDISGACGFDTSAATVTVLDCGVATTSATMPADDVIAVPTSGEFRIKDVISVTLASVEKVYSIPTYRVVLGSTTSLYLVSRAAFSAGSVSTYGFIQARRQ